MYIFYNDKEDNELKIKEIGEGFNKDEFVLGSIICSGGKPIFAHDKETANILLNNFNNIKNIQEVVEEKASELNYRNNNVDTEVYYKLYLCDNNKFEPVCLQWFDEYDYDDTRFFKNMQNEDIVLYNEEDAEQLCNWLNYIKGGK